MGDCCAGGDFGGCSGIFGLWEVERLPRNPETRRGTAVWHPTTTSALPFLAQFGWQVEAEPLEIRDAAIPVPICTRCTSNTMPCKKQQGFDLEPLAGKVCRQWVYEVTNYPAETPCPRPICWSMRTAWSAATAVRTELDGFMLPFDAPGSGNAGTASSAVSSALPGERGLFRGPGFVPGAGFVRGSPPGLLFGDTPANAWPTD